jgi:hypothetical protein
LSTTKTKAAEQQNTPYRIEHLKLYSPGPNLQSGRVIENASRVQPVRLSLATCRQTDLAFDWETVILRTQENPSPVQRSESHHDP